MAKKKPESSETLVRLSRVIAAVESVRMARPKKPPGSHRRRVGDVIRWKANNDTIDRVVAELGDLGRTWAP